MAESQERLSVDIRYQAVWNQTTAVLTERYRILFQYAAVVLTLLGVAVSRDEARELALAIPYISLVAVMILTHMELIIELLTENQRGMVERHGLQDGDRSATEEWNFDRLGAEMTIWSGILLHTLPVCLIVAGTSGAAFWITSNTVTHSMLLYLVRAEGPYVTAMALGLAIGIQWWRVAQIGKAQRRIRHIT